MIDKEYMTDKKNRDWISRQFVYAALMALATLVVAAHGSLLWALATAASAALHCFSARNGDRSWGIIASVFTGAVLMGIGGFPHMPMTLPGRIISEAIGASSFISGLFSVSRSSSDNTLK